MDLSEKLLDRWLRVIIAFQSIGKEEEYVYQADSLRFHVRKGTSDRFVVDEVLSDKSYDIGIREDAVVVDIGANIGAFTVWAGKIANRGKVIAFEPERSNFNQLNKNLALNALKNVTACAQAVAGKRGRLTLFTADQNKGAASLYESHGAERQDIECITLEDVFALNELERVDVLKLDVEGAEYEILFAAPEGILARIQCVVLEFHDYLGRNTDYRTLVRLLEQNGFRVQVKANWLARTVFKYGVLTATR